MRSYSSHRRSLTAVLAVLGIAASLLAAVPKARAQIPGPLVSGTYHYQDADGPGTIQI